jgi:hypothetical protein
MNNTYFKLFAIALIAGFLGGILSSKVLAPKPVSAETGYISIKGLQVTDEYGLIRIRMTVFASGEPGITFYDSQGKSITEIKSGEITIMNRDGDKNIFLGIDRKKGEAALNFLNNGETIWKAPVK